MLAKEEIEAYLKPLTPDQAENIQALRALLQECSPSLVEKIGEEKSSGSLLLYAMPEGTVAYAMGPRAGGKTTFHMMPYYVSKTLQERHGAALKAVLNGKACILFRKYAQVPEEALRDILVSAKEVLQEAQEAQSRRKQRKSSKTAAG